MVHPKQPVAIGLLNSPGANKRRKEPCIESKVIEVGKSGNEFSFALISPSMIRLAILEHKITAPIAMDRGRAARLGWCSHPLSASEWKSRPGRASWLVSLEASIAR